MISRHFTIRRNSLTECQIACGIPSPAQGSGAAGSGSWSPAAYRSSTLRPRLPTTTSCEPADVLQECRAGTVRFDEVGHLDIGIALGPWRQGVQQFLPLNGLEAIPVDQLRVREPRQRAELRPSMDGLDPDAESVGELEGGRERSGTGSHSVDAKNEGPVSGRGIGIPAMQQRDRPNVPRPRLLSNRSAGPRSAIPPRIRGRSAGRGGSAPSGLSRPVRRTAL